MLDYIERLQKKPEQVRRRVLYVTVSFLMFIVIGVWASTLFMRFSAPDGAESGSTAQNSSPVNIVKEYGASLYENLTGAVSAAKSRFPR